MTKEQFIKLMEAIKDRYYKIEQIYDNIASVFGSVGDSFIEDTVMNDIIDVIAEIVGDTNEWIWWYIEKEWGKRGDLKAFDTDDDDNEIPSETLEDLWNLIHMGSSPHMTENEKDNYPNDLHMDGIGFFANSINKGGDTN